MELVSIQEINQSLGLGVGTIHKSSPHYAHLFEGITPQTISVKPDGSRNSIRKNFVTKDEAEVIERRYAMGKLSKKSLTTKNQKLWQHFVKS